MGEWCALPNRSSFQPKTNPGNIVSGRRYHAYFGVDKNLLPTDETEQERMDLHHELFLRLLNGELHKAPLQEPHWILDVGTGKLIWA
jgi:hypothetical protein